MKPLLANKVQRVDIAEPIKEWEPAEHHLTHDGQHSFHARMMARIRAAQQVPTNVSTIKRVKEKQA